MTFDSIQEDSHANVTGLCGPDGCLDLAEEDVLPRGELRTRAAGLMAKYGVALADLSDGLKASLAPSPKTLAPPPE
jgi:hypothetical protein